MSSAIHFLPLLDVVRPLHDEHYAKGAMILGPDTDKSRCYIIRQGIVKIYTIDRSGDEEIRVLYGPGEFFPLYWILGKPSSNTYFQAQTDCVIASIPQTKLIELINTDIQVATSMLQRMTRQFAVYTARLDNLAYRYSRERLAYRLLLLARRFGEPADEHGSVILPPLSQQDIGASIHTARESVNRELSRFERMGIIEQRKGRIVILQHDKLRQEIGTSRGTLYFDSE